MRAFLFASTDSGVCSVIRDCGRTVGWWVAWRDGDGGQLTRFPVSI